MTIAIGDTLPEGRLAEYIDTETPGCTLGPNRFAVTDLVKGKTIVIFGVPAAFSPACSEQHLPGYVEKAEELKAKGVDEIWCLAVNDPYVMGAWGRDQNTAGAVRMMADGSGAYTQALGLVFDLTKAGMGVRSQRYSMLVVDGVVKQLNIDEGGKYEVSGADTMLTQLN